MKVYRCDLTPQFDQYEEEIMTAVRKVFKSGRYVLADELDAFEKEFAAYLKVGYCVGNANATDGLVLALKLFGVGPGDEVITTPFTAVPTSSAILAVVATPVFVDVVFETYLMDITKVAAAITPKTKVVMPVHIFGNVVDVVKLKSTLPAAIRIIEDAAQAHGATINGRYAGTMGDVGIFSFYPTKNLGGLGDGGAIVTNSKELCEKMKLMRNYGFVNKDETVTRGINTRLDEVQAAILRIKLKDLDSMNAARERIAQSYYKTLPSKYFEFQKIPEGVTTCHHVFVPRFKGNKEALIKYLDECGIQTNVYYKMPLYDQKVLQEIDFKKVRLPNVERLCQEVIALPMYPEMPDNILGYVLDKISSWSEK